MAAAPPVRSAFESLPDDLLEQIFLRIASPGDLVRASAACATFRRVATAGGPSFLRRYRSAHPPLLLGLISRQGLHPAEPPHPNAPAARALAASFAARFDDYVSGGRWQTADARDGRVLLARAPSGYSRSMASFPELAVCDPLTRRHRLLPPIPDDLVASVQVQVQLPEHKIYFFEPLLVPSGQHEEEDDETLFRVIARTSRAEKLVIYVFSSGSGRWTVGASTSCVDDLSLNPPPCLNLGWTQYDHGCFYWKVWRMNKLLKLDIDRM